IIDLKTMETRKVRLGNAPEHFMVSHDGGWAYVGNMEEGTVSIVDLVNNKEVNRIPGFYEPHGFSILPDMSKVYVSNLGAHEIGVIDVKSQKLIKTIYIGNAHILASLNLDKRLSEINGIANPTITLDGRYLYAADGDSNQVAVIDTRTDNVVRTIPVGQNPWRAYMSPDGTKAVVPNNDDQTVTVIDVKTHKVITTFPGGEGMTGINFVNGGKKAYIISQPESALYVIDMEKYRELKRIKFGEGLMLETATTTPDGKTVYLACSTNNSVYIIDGITDNYTRIPDVGLSPWAVEIIGGNSYCH
ncbi:MAG TPA: YncE family protein, partial [Candidatus Wunengus californicus]|uniref:YncE family protein n=1 Tax=Candidatus Wunengus californicus TaxID=3367619 RepID=UPI0040265587